MDEPLTLPDLGDLEHEVMQLVWARGTLTAEQAREALTRSLKESTVRTVLRRLEDKGYVTHTVEGRTSILSPPKRAVPSLPNAVQQIVDRLCNGSLKEVPIGMVNNAAIDPRQLQLRTQSPRTNRGPVRARTRRSRTKKRRSVNLYI